MPAEKDLTVRVIDAVRWLGLPGVVLLAALLTDLAIIVPAAFDDLGPPGIDLWAVPGILGLTACALWARLRPGPAAFAGAAVLVISSVLIRYNHAPLYTTLLTHISFAETVAGCELVFYSVRRLKPGQAFAMVSSLVVACLIAVIGRGSNLTPGQLMESAVFGALLLGLSVAIGFQGRTEQQPTTVVKPRDPDSVSTLAREHWPIIGILSLMLFFELAAGFEGGGLRTLPIIVCSIGAALAALYSTRYPVRASVALAMVMAVSAVATPFLRLGTGYPIQSGIPITQVAAGLIAVVFLIRYAQQRSAWLCIGLLSTVVAGAVIINADPWGRSWRRMLDPERLQPYVVVAVLTLGIAVAIGLFLKSRDSERKQVVKSAVTDAQTSERMALARELHDVVAHHVTGIVVQAQAAKMVGEQSPQVALEALDRIENAGTEALAAMRRLVRSMRGDAPAGSTDYTEQATTDLAADLRNLVESSNHGVPTRLDLRIDRQLPHEVGRSALRLVQESLTNIGKHATGAELATVVAEINNGKLYLRITDDGHGTNQRPAGGSGGYGLIGMRERVELLHGELVAGPGPLGGWSVEVWLPLEGEE
ncbi:sensor histidine kinase [Amycolatopsis sp. NPDC059657]|uniref:sensor histidine kinase n=1 Tax=Amycolatopsis sp. NPDC059657 TaxID=3346899 RepID=UPI0036703807